MKTFLCFSCSVIGTVTVLLALILIALEPVYQLARTGAELSSRQQQLLYYRRRCQQATLIWFMLCTLICPVIAVVAIVYFFII